MGEEHSPAANILSPLSNALLPSFQMDFDRDNENPFQSELARANSCYGVYEGGILVLPLMGKRPANPLVQFVHRQFRLLIRRRSYPCVGAKAAIRRGTYRFGLYSALGSAPATAGLCRDLYTFVQEQPSLAGNFTTFIACFSSPLYPDELEFEELLWKQLQRLLDEDSQYHEWDPAVSSNPEDKEFSFSFARRAFFIVGLHANSARAARQFVLPTLVFNAHEQFENLRREGKFKRLQRTIRRRDIALEGNINPILADYGELPEARQYSGRNVAADWKCPLQVQRRGREDVQSH